MDKQTKWNMTEELRHQLATLAAACNIPDYMAGGLLRYIVIGVEPVGLAGSFLMAVLENDLMGALGKADTENQNKLFNYGRFLYNYAPAGCYGSPEKVAAWIKQGGLEIKA